MGSPRDASSVQILSDASLSTPIATWKTRTLTRTPTAAGQAFATPLSAPGWT